MSDKAPKSKGNEPQGQDSYLTELSTLAEEYNQDRKILRYAFIAAAVFHVVLFMINFPQFAGKLEAGQKKQRKIFVVQQPKFKPPEVKKQVEVLKPRTVKVPIPPSWKRGSSRSGNAWRDCGSSTWSRSAIPPAPSFRTVGAWNG